MNIDSLKRSRFLKKEDCDPTLTVTIDRVEQESMVGRDGKAELKWCVFFRAGIRPMVLYSTNAQLIAHLLGSKNSDDWTGKQIELYHDPNVSFGGEVLGGIRVRKARAKLAMPVKVAVEEELVGEPG